jgi:hypothetical protein
VNPDLDWHRNRAASKRRVRVRFEAHRIASASQIITRRCRPTVLETGTDSSNSLRSRERNIFPQPWSLFRGSDQCSGSICRTWCTIAVISIYCVRVQWPLSPDQYARSCSDHGGCSHPAVGGGVALCLLLSASAAAHTHAPARQPSAASTRRLRLARARPAARHPQGERRSRAAVRYVCRLYAAHTLDALPPRDQVRRARLARVGLATTGKKYSTRILR